MNPLPGDDPGDLNEAKESASWPVSGLLPPAPAPSRAERAIAGVQAGAFAAMVTLGWWMLAGLPNNQSIWTLPNLMGSAIYGQRSLRAGVGPFTAAGLSIHTLLCVLLALVMSQLLPPRIRLVRAVLFGTLGACIWFYFLESCFWRAASPAFVLYSKQAPIFFGFLLQGLCVGLYSVFVRTPKATKFQLDPTCEP